MSSLARVQPLFMEEFQGMSLDGSDSHLISATLAVSLGKPGPIKPHSTHSLMFYPNLGVKGGTMVNQDV